MDIITQAALGACIAQAGFSNKLGRKALVVGAACGILPDCDFILSAGADNFTYLATHRGWSHSLLVLPFVALPAAWLAMKWGMRRKKSSTTQLPSSVDSYWVWYHLCFWALITHPLLDLFTSWGTQIFTPLSNARFTLDGVAIIDPFYTIPIIAAIVIGLVKPNKPGRNWLWARRALIFSSLYLCLGLFNSWDARQTATEQLSAESFKPIDVMVSPTMLNNVLWRVVAKDAADRFAVGFFSSISRKPIRFQIYESDRGELVNKAISSNEGQILHWFSMDMLKAQVKEEADDDNLQVVLTDMRFGLVSKPSTSFLTGNFEFDQKHNLSRVFNSEDNIQGFEPTHELNAIWSMIWSGG